MLEVNTHKQVVLGIIPARYESTRLPGKPLYMIGDKTIIQHTYEQSIKAIEDVIVATDDVRIYDEVKRFGGMALMTSKEHKSGTDRICEALNIIGKRCDIVINIQGDEPFIPPTLLKELINAFDDPNTDIATPICPYPSKASIEEVSNPNQVKVVTSNDGFALYFSRYPIPYVRNIEEINEESVDRYFKHIGIYAFRSQVLDKVTTLPISPLERCEKLEQLRWLQAGYKIKTILTYNVTIGVDTEEDLQVARAYYNSKIESDKK